MTTTPIAPAELEQTVERARELERISAILAEFSEHVDTSAWQNISINGGGFITATIPISQINRNNFPLNHAHSADLGRRMSEQAEKTGGTGQIDPVDLVTVVGEKGLEITDGFHRYDGLLQNGEELIHAVLRANVTREELIDMRIAATRKLGFELPRTVEMAQESWQSTPWAEKLTVLQAFKMEATVQQGRSYRLTAQERADITAWMEDKKGKWSLTPEEVYQYLLSVGEHDQEITSLMRELGPKKDLGFTPKIADRVVPKFRMDFGETTITDTDMVTLIAETANRMLLSYNESIALANMVYDAAVYEVAAELVSSLSISDIREEVKRRARSSSPKKAASPKSAQLPAGPRDPAPIQDESIVDQDVTNISTARTIEEIIKNIPSDNLLDALSRAIVTLKLRKYRGDILDNPYNATKLRQMGNALIDLAGGDPSRWGVHQGPYSTNQALRDATNAIFDYFMLGGDKPKLPGSPGNQASQIVGDLGKLLAGKALTESQQLRVLDFKREWSSRFSAEKS